MRTDPIELLRAANPLPDGSSAPPVEVVLGRIKAGGSPRRRRARRGLLLPTLGVATAVAVVAVALALVRPHHAPVSHPAHKSPPAEVKAPKTGMRGVVEIYGEAFPSADLGVVSLQQCQPCHAAPHGGRQRFQDWLVRTTDGGARWQVTRRHFNLFQPQFEGADGWAQGVQAGVGAGGLVLMYVTHDGGRTWKVAPTKAPPLGDGPVSVVGGEVWTVGSGCRGEACTTSVVRGPVTGSSLPLSPTQPVGGDHNNLHAVGAGPGIAYVMNDDNPSQSYVTHDDGRSWRRLAPPCARGAFGRLDVADVDALWAQCNPRKGPEVLSRSTDGGRSWQTQADRFGFLFSLQPTSALVAWAMTTRGHVVRTTDGGQTWKTVWSVGGSQPAALAGHTPQLTTRTDTVASIVVTLSRGSVQHHAAATNLVVYRTSDGGQTWKPGVIHLPAGRR